MWSILSGLRRSCADSLSKQWSTCWHTSAWIESAPLLLIHRLMLSVDRSAFTQIGRHFESDIVAHSFGFVSSARLFHRLVAKVCPGSMSGSEVMTQVTMLWFALRDVPSSLPDICGFQVALLLFQLAVRQDLSGTGSAIWITEWNSGSGEQMFPLHRTQWTPARAGFHAVSPRLHCHRPAAPADPFPRCR